LFNQLTSLRLAREDWPERQKLSENTPDRYQRQVNKAKKNDVLTPDVDFVGIV